MAYYNSKIITCAKCGRRFTWSAGEQKHFKEIGFEDRKYCARCREIRNDYFRSSQVDHPANPVPTELPTFLPTEPAEPPLPPPNPNVEKRPVAEPDPSRKYTMALWILILLTFLVLVLLLIMLF